MSFRMTFSDLEWLGEIFNDTKHCAVSLRQLSFLFFLRHNVVNVHKAGENWGRRALCWLFCTRLLIGKGAKSVAFVRPSVCPSVVYIANNSRTHWPSMPKFGTKVPHLRCDSHTSLVKGLGYWRARAYRVGQTRRPHCLFNFDFFISLRHIPVNFLSASLYFSKRGAYWDRLCRDVVGWLSRACTVAKRCILGL